MGLEVNLMALALVSNSYNKTECGEKKRIAKTKAKRVRSVFIITINVSKLLQQCGI